MVTGAVPVEVNVTGSVVGVFNVTLPNARLVGLTVNVQRAFSCKAKGLEMRLRSPSVSRLHGRDRRHSRREHCTGRIGWNRHRTRHSNRRIAARQAHTQTAAPCSRGQRHRAIIVPRSRHRRTAARKRAQRSRPAVPCRHPITAIRWSTSCSEWSADRRSTRQVGSNCTCSVTDWVGFKVAGNVAPTSCSRSSQCSELMVTGASPWRPRHRQRVGVFNATLPNARLVGLTVNVPTAAFSCKAKVLEMPPALAVSVTACTDVTDDTVAVNPALVRISPSTVTLRRTIRRIVARQFTVKPPLPALAVNVNRAIIVL